MSLQKAGLLVTYLPVWAADKMLKMAGIVEERIDALIEERIDAYLESETVQMIEEVLGDSQG